LAYVLFGSVLEFGLQDKFEALFEEVQRSNMSKLDENGRPIKREDGKILKGPNFFLPDLKGIIEQ
jgi:predicted HAD superfamily Cof-like phosphohydrolase